MSVLATTPPNVPHYSPQTSPSLEPPRGGILLNGDSPRRPSISLPSESPPLGGSSSGSFMSRISPASLGGAGTSLAYGGPVPAINITGSTSTPAAAGAAGTSAPTAQAAPPRIRFAPLPDAQRPRSLSTGRNIGWSTAEDAEGNEYRKMEMRNVPVHDNEYDQAVDDEEDDEEDENTHSDGGSKSRRWSKGMSSSWKVSKKILTVGLLDDTKDKEKDKADGYGGGMPLKKSVSTGGMIGSSPFRWTNIEERKRSMQGLAPESTHRRQSSVETGSSPQPVKLLNGRVYGARRASEIAEMQKKRREAAEPAFVEWGNAKPETTAAPAEGGGGRGFLGDADEGSGMEWVKRRRAEREQAKAKREAEEKARAAQAETSASDGVAPDEVPPLSASSPYSSENERVDIVTPAQQTSELPTTPIIHVSEHDGHTPRNLAASGRHDMGESETKAIQIKPSQAREETRDVFDDGDDDDESEEEEEEDDPDAEDDEEDVPMPRTTSSAAGIEVLSRHHH